MHLWLIQFSSLLQIFDVLLPGSLQLVAFAVPGHPVPRLANGICPTGDISERPTELSDVLLLRSHLFVDCAQLIGFRGKSTHLYKRNTLYKSNYSSLQQPIGYYIFLLLGILEIRVKIRGLHGIFCFSNFNFFFFLRTIFVSPTTISCTFL